MVKRRKRGTLVVACSYLNNCGKNIQTIFLILVIADTWCNIKKNVFIRKRAVIQQVVLGGHGLSFILNATGDVN